MHPPHETNSYTGMHFDSGDQGMTGGTIASLLLTVRGVRRGGLERVRAPGSYTCERAGAQAHMRMRCLHART